MVKIALSIETTLTKKMFYSIECDVDYYVEYVVKKKIKNGMFAPEGGKRFEENKFDGIWRGITNHTLVSVNDPKHPLRSWTNFAHVIATLKEKMKRITPYE